MAVFLEKNELKDAYGEAQVDARRYFEPFDEFERLAANKIRRDLGAIYPKVNDGTLAALLLENAKRQFPSLYTGKFTSLDRDELWVIELINILWQRRLIPGAKSDASFFVKFWNMHYRVQQHGASSAFAFFKSRDDYRGADFVLDYIRDVLPEPGKLAHASGNYVWRNSYHTKLDLLNIIAAAKKEQERAKAEKRDSESTWDTKVLEAYVNQGPTGKDPQDKNLTEREKQLAATHYKFATCFHRGYDAPFYSIVPDMEGKLVRTRFNENPTGDTPIIVMYHTQDLVNPYGKGLVEVAGSAQNVADYMTQADVLATQKGMQPPVKVQYTTSTPSGYNPKSITHGPNAIWQLGTANASVVETTNSVYAELPNRIGLYKSNVMNQAGAFDNTVSSSDGNPQFSKTDAGVNTLNSRENINDNFAATNGSIAFAQLAKTLMNITMANMEGVEVFTLLKDEVERLQNAGWDLGGSNKALVDYERLRGKFEFEPDDPTNSDDPETDGLLAAIKIVSENPEVIQEIEADGQFKFVAGELYRQYFAKLNLSQLDKIIVPTNTNGGQPTATAPKDASQTADGKGVSLMPQQRGPAEAMNFKDVAAESPLAGAAMLQQAGLPADELLAKAQAQQESQAAAATSMPSQPPAEDPQALQDELNQTMQTYPVDHQKAAVIMALRRHGTPEEAIARYFKQQGGAK